ncbi:MAG: BamA/OMP85 family outer membrane protein [Gemmatimonadales bacterium]
MRIRIAVALLAALAVGPLAAQEAQRVVRELAFQGNRALDDQTLSIAIATSSSSYFARVGWLRWLGLGDKRTFDELEFRRDVVRLLLLYRQSGYMRAVVDTVVRRTERDVFITFRIHEGEPVRLERLDIVGVEGIVNVAALKGDLPIREGDPFNRALFVAAADTLATRLRNLGYPYAEVLRHFETDAATLVAQASLEALPGRRMVVGEVAIEGLEDVDTGTVRRMLSVKPGDLYREARLYQSQRDLYGMEVFRLAQVALMDSVPPADPADSTVRVRVRMVEGPRHRVRAGAGYGTVDCVRVQAGWAAHNFLGGARTLNVDGRFSRIGVGYPFDNDYEKTLCPALKDDFTKDTLNYSVGATLSQPGFLAPRHRATIGAFAQRYAEPKVFVRRAIGGDVSVTFNYRGRIPLTLGYGYSLGQTTAPSAVYCSVFQVCDAADQAFLRERRPFAAVTLSATRARVNSPIEPTRGSIITATLTYSSRLVGSDSLYEFNRGELELARYHVIGRGQVFAWRVRAGAILPQRITLSGQNARFVPPDQRFYAGGPNSVRGYGLNELGPAVYVTRDTTDTVTTAGGDTVYRSLRVAPTGGNTAFVINAELRFPAPVLGERIRLGVFVDIGQVWEREEQLLTLNDVRITPGVGVRFATPLGPIRLDVGYNGYGREPGPLYFLDETDPQNPTLTLYRNSYRPSAPDSFWKRLRLQFAVGQAF